MKNLILIALAALLILAFSFEKNRDGIVIKNSEGVYRNSLSGGYNNPEHQFVDIDGDSDFDLFILNSDGFYAFLENEGSATNPDFIEQNFPSGLDFINWFFFCDINSDGVQDCFTGLSGNYVRLFTGAINNGEIVFTMTIDTVRTVDGNVMISESVSNPALVDIDKDDDLDFFITDQSGSILFYENTGTSANFEFTFVTDAWQDILIVGGGKSDKHGAASIDFCDIDGDNDYDLFWGDFFSNSLYFIKNNGTDKNPDMELVADIYPEINPVSTRGFNMPRFVDIDDDADFDLFVSVLYDPTVLQDIIYLENTGTPTNATFNFVSDRYLATFDAISKSLPVFADMDADGDMDLLVGSEKNPQGSIYYLENTGTTAALEFTLIDSFYTGYTDGLSLAPAVGDLDGDGDNDMLLGTFLGDIKLFINSGTPEEANFTTASNLRDHSGEVIKTSTYPRPLLIDIDDDGDNDLLIGSFNGRIKCYINEGGIVHYSFVEDTELFEGLFIGAQSNICGFKISGESRQHLLAGNRYGELHLLRNTGSAGNPVFNTSELLEDFPFEGKELAPAAADLDNDGDLDLILGNIRGGLTYYSNEQITGLSPESKITEPDFKISAYPNPFNGTITFHLNDPANIKSATIYDINGREITSLEVDKSNFPLRWSPKKNLASGIYFAAFLLHETKIITQKIVYLK